MCVNSASTVLRGGRSTIYRKVKRLSSTRLLLAIGLFAPLVSALLAVTMVCAIVKVHWRNGLWNTDNGYEYNLVLIAILAAIVLIGPGELAVDALF
ncbi:hypothetical protein CYL18_18075 [Pradoshia eiseniae]|uniref:Uncharacterized protein n=1 Tax=Pradoshia eiseniae TaxID=2064768 RepID=A0A2S7MVK6_9BACI|nr:DoxX family protein [Pradoshia eiseniae]PQD93785.1 hypothetical protein CYL18_18075 [Pradoshia eiseniae]